MADPIDYDRLAEAIANAINSAGVADSLLNDIEANKEATKEKVKFIKAMRESSGVTGTFSRILTGKTEDLTATIEKNRKAMEELAERYKSATTDEQRREIKKTQRDAKSAALLETLSVAFSNASLGVIKFTTTLVDAAGAAGAQLVRGLQNSTSGIQLTTGVLNAGVGVAGSAAQALAGATTAVGTGLMAILKGPFKLLGAAVAGLGTAFGFLAERVTRVVKFGIEIMSVELEKTVAAFRATSQAGALFGDGLTGMRNAALAAGLTVDQFSKVLQQHSTDIANVGLGVTQGAVKMGKVLTTGGDQMKRQLLNLGYGFEEQAGLVAETMSMMRGYGGPLSATNTEIVQQTTKYAESLRLISAITGEDAKKKMAQVRQQAQVLAFQQWLNTKDAKTRQNIIAAMGTMSEMDKKNFMDRAVIGQVINKEGAVAEATVRGLRQLGEEQFRQAQTGELTAESNAKLNAAFGRTIIDSTMSLKSLGIASYVLPGLLNNVGQGLLQNADNLKLYTKESVDAANAAVQEQLNSTDPLTKSLAVATIAAQNLALKFQEAMLPMIGLYAKVAEKMLTEIDKTFEALRAEMSAFVKGEKTPATKEAIDTTKGIAGAVGQTGGAIVGGLAGAKYGAMIGALAGPIGSVAGAVIGSLLGTWGGGTAGRYAGEKGVEKTVELTEEAVKSNEGLLSKIEKMLGLRTGGISKGPGQGYLQKLHGTEAVVPLPDGRTIPVKVDLETADTTTARDSSEVIKLDINSLLADSGINIKDSLASVDAFRNSIDYGATTFKDTFDFVKSGINTTESVMSTYIDTVLAKLATESTQTVSRVIDEFGASSTSLFKGFGKDADATLKKHSATFESFKVTPLSPGAIGLESNKFDLKTAKPDLDSVVNELREKIEVSTASTVNNKIEMSNLKLDQESVSQLRTAMLNSNSEVKELLSTQNDLLQKNIMSMDRLADLMGDNYAVNTRMYREMT